MACSNSKGSRQVSFSEKVEINNSISSDGVSVSLALTVAADVINALNQRALNDAAPQRMGLAHIIRLFYFRQPKQHVEVFEHF